MSCELVQNRVYSRLLRERDGREKDESLGGMPDEIEDPRMGNGKRHELVEVLVIAICAIFANVEGFEDMAEWARK